MISGEEIWIPPHSLTDSLTDSLTMRQYPDWLKQPFSPHGVAREVGALVGDLQLVTVCESARCPNLRECYSLRQLTFMILGDRCTRRCGSLVSSRRTWA